LGWPSSHEHDQDKRDDAAFAEHKMANDLKKLLVAPVAKQKKSKQSKSVRGAPKGKMSLVARLERTVRQQTAQITELEEKLEQARQALGAERSHIRQLRDRGNKSSDLLLQAEIRQLKQQHQAETAKFRAALEAKDQELENLRQMHELFGKNG
jgi:chromosome segregation ATPase